MRLDCHHSFWTYDPQNPLAWDSGQRELPEELQRDFLPTELEPLVHHHSLVGSIAVAARPGLKETEWLIGQAHDHPWISGVVGWLDLTSPDLIAQLDEFLTEEKLVGVRTDVRQNRRAHLLTDEDFQKGVSCLSQYELTCEISCTEDQLDDLCKLADSSPQQRFVLDHLGSPQIPDDAHDFELWQNRLRKVAHRSNIFAKVSGLVTTLGTRDWKPAQLAPYFSAALQAFGPRRLLWGSDWPYVLTAASYDDWYQAAKDFFGRLTKEEFDHVFGMNAQTVYHVEPGEEELFHLSEERGEDQDFGTMTQR